MALLIGAVSPALPSPATTSLTLTPVADTTLFQIAPDHNLGGADFFNAGTAGNGNHNRGLLRFDVAGRVPPDSIIRSAELVLEVVRQPAVRERVDSTFSLHRVLRPWGEGSQIPEPASPGLGAPAAPGEATWTHRFAFTGQTWAVPGGAEGIDYGAIPSGEQFIEGVADSPYTFFSEPLLVADVQFWLDQPQANFGWMLISQAEGTRYTARSFGAREGGFPALLHLEFEPIPEPRTLGLVASGLLVLALGWRRRRGKGTRDQGRKTKAETLKC